MKNLNEDKTYALLVLVNILSVNMIPNVIAIPTPSMVSDAMNV